MQMYMSSLVVDSFERYPDSVITGLAKIGGILGLLKVASMILFQWHKYMFNKIGRAHV